MDDFLRRFGEEQADGSYAFSNVRSGLIVGLVSGIQHHGLSKETNPTDNLFSCVSVL